MTAKGRTGNETGKKPSGLSTTAPRQDFPVRPVRSFFFARSGKDTRNHSPDTSQGEDSADRDWLHPGASGRGGGPVYSAPSATRPLTGPSLGA